MKRKICVVTGSRAEYGLLYWLLKALKDDPECDLQLVATGTHLSEAHGLTCRQIEHDGFTLANQVKLTLSDDSAAGLTKAIGQGVMGFSDVFAALKPHLLVVLGDRYEIFSAVIAAHMAGLPVAHLHGGETTTGAVDEAFRHSITKMAQLHFVAAGAYRKRVIQLGENPDRVFLVGAMAGANLHRTKPLNKAELQKELAFEFGTKNLLVTFHPETLSAAAPETQMEALLKALNELPETKLIFTLPNADAGSGEIARMIKDYTAENPGKAVWFATLGLQRYLSVLQFVNGVVGNSSSGLLEAPGFYVGTLNIGNRQAGRLKATSVIDCEANYASIRSGLRKLLSPEFQQSLPATQNPYGNQDPVNPILHVLKTTELATLMQKSFFDIPFQLPE